MSTDWESCGARAEKLSRQRRWKQALKWFVEALRHNPLDTSSREAYRSDLAGKIDCLVRLGRFGEAKRAMNELQGLRRRRGGVSRSSRAA